MEMIRHQHVAEDLPTVPSYRSLEAVDKPLPIRIVSHNVLTPVSAGHHVVDRARKLDAKRTGHRANLPVDCTEGDPNKRINRSDPIVPDGGLRLGISL